jgi:hypothetical protein
MASRISSEHFDSEFEKKLDGRKGGAAAHRSRDLRERYYHKLNAAYFVLALPGLGYDCYRNWETITMGSMLVAERGVGLDRTVCAQMSMCLCLCLHFPVFYMRLYCTVVLQAAGAASG